MIEYRVCWSASSNSSFEGQSDWNACFEETVSEAERALLSGGAISRGLSEVLEVSGFEWWPEFRESGTGEEPHG